MSYPVFTDTQRKSYLIPNGVYIGEVTSCIEKQSKSGNPMWELKIKIDDGDARASIFDYILLTADFAWKMKALTESLGVPYDGKLEAEDVVGRGVHVSVGTQQQPGFDAKNRIENYLPKHATGEPVAVDEFESIF